MYKGVPQPIYNQSVKYEQQELMPDQPMQPMQPMQRRSMFSRFLPTRNRMNQMGQMRERFRDKVASKIGEKKVATIYFIIINTIIYLIFAGIYYGLRSNDNFSGLDEKASFIDALYFTLTTQSTIGYGDISPKSIVARKIVMIHQLFVIVALGDFIINSLVKKS